MKKSILSFLLLFATLATFATRWTAPSMNDYSDRYVVYTQVNVNGMKSNNVEVAAFIDGQVRGVANYTSLNNLGHLNLEVRGNESDNGKTITFKVAFNSLVYKVEKTLTYQHQSTYASFPFVINVDAITGVVLTNPININQVIGTTYDLTNDISFLYEPLNLDGAPEYYNRMYETTLDTEETPLTYMWDFGNSSQFFTVGDNNILTVRDYNENLYLGLMVSGPVDPSVMTHVAQFQTRTFTTVNITKPAVPVTDILLSETTVKLYMDDSAFNVLFPIISFVPSDASNQAFKLVPNDAAAAAGIGGEDEKYIAKIPGTYSFRVVSVENENIYKNLTIVVVQPVTDLIWNRDESRIEVWKGDNAYEEIAKNINILPANASDKTLIFSPSDANAFEENGVAVATGTYTVTVRPKEGTFWFNPLVIEVEVKQAVEAIHVTPNKISVNVGDNVSDYILQNVNVDVLPETANNRRYRVQPSDADANFFPNNIATTAGTYTWEVISDQNPEVKTNITVKVIVPVSFVLPDMIDLTLLTPGQGSITEVTGDYDASLVTFNTNGEVEVSISDKTITLTGKKLGDGEFEVFYEGESMGMVPFNVNAEMQLQSGWNWISNYTDSEVALQTATGYIPSLFTGTSKILEARSQEDLLFNLDGEVFGDITSFEPGKMYKVKTNNAMTIIPNGSAPFDGNVTISYKGYTWFGYPVIGDHTLGYFNTNNLLSAANNGDVIIGKSGFASYDGSKWISSSDFKLETGKGYIYYTEQAGQKTLDFGDNYVSEPSTTSAKSVFGNKANVWKYDAQQFSDNMAIIATLEGLEADGRYSVGAFVGDECRGKGEFVEGNLMFINVAGKAGEQVSFRLYDSETGEYTQIPETLSHRTLAGTLAKPIVLSPEMQATGIHEIKAAASNAPAYNLNGQRVNANAKGIIIINGVKAARK